MGWKASLTNTSETIKNKTLEKELSSKNEEIKRLKLQVDSLKEITASTVSQNNPQRSFSRESIISLDSEDDVFLDATEETSDLNEMLEKELQLKNKEIEEIWFQCCSLLIVKPFGRPAFEINFSFERQGFGDIAISAR